MSEVPLQVGRGVEDGGGGGKPVPNLQVGDSNFIDQCCEFTPELKFLYAFTPETMW